MTLTKRLLFVLALLIGVLIGSKLMFQQNNLKSSGGNKSHLPTGGQPTPSTVPPLPISQPTITSPSKFSSVFLDSNELSVETVSTPEAITQGLSNRNEIGSDGMLFVISPPQVEVFWMKDMLFPIDILWIKDGKVTGILRNVPIAPSDASEEKLPTFSSKTPVDYVLELPSGYAEKYAVQIGSTFKL